MFRRNSLRAPHIDYRNGAFLVTICAHRRQPVFGHIEDDRFIASTLGCTVIEAWDHVVGGDPSIEVHIVQGMPDHLHSVLTLINSRRSLDVLVGSVKSRATRCARERHQWGEERLWQRSFHESALNSDESIAAAIQYVQNNPRNWRKP